MRCIHWWSLVLTGLALELSTSLGAAQGTLPAVEEWQIKGINAALKDGYPEVRERAARQLANLVVGGPKRPVEGQLPPVGDRPDPVLAPNSAQGQKPRRPQRRCGGFRGIESCRSLPALVALLKDPIAMSASPRSLGCGN